MSQVTFRLWFDYIQGTGVAGEDFPVVADACPESCPENAAVDCSSVRHCGEDLASPRRIRGHSGHSGSAAYRPDETECAVIPGYGHDRLSKLSPERRLELLGTMLIHCEDASAAWQRQRDARRRNRIGGAEFTDTASQRMKPASLRDIAAAIDNSRERSESLADSIVIYLDRLSAGFGSYLSKTDDVVLSAKLCGISKSKAYRLIESVRNSWESLADSASIV